MNHWTAFLTFALCHAEAMKYAQISVDPMQIAAAMQQAAQEARRMQGIVSAPTRFDPGLLNSLR